MHIRKQNFFNTTFALIKFVLFWCVVVLHIPVLCFIPRGKYSVKYMRFFMWTLAKISGIRVKMYGNLSKMRPLLVVCNHISVFEFVTMPIGFGGSFVGKIDIAGYPVVGWVAKKFGVIFIDRRPSHAIEAIKSVQTQLSNAQYPIVLFPEGTTTNGAYVKEFKSSMFNILENSQNITVQPIVMNYRYRDGSIINDVDMANHFAYFDNNKQDFGPKCKRERSAFGQVFHIMMLGGFLVEITALDTVNIAGKDRKEIATTLQKIVSENYMNLKNKQRG
ncbi:MAG: lysophospholipid acyltransferase family protein [Alphaproteobacteria bacterium]